MNGRQGDLFKAETTWFHIFRDMVESGDVAKMGPHAVTTYLVIKAHTNFATGQSFPGVDTIAAKAGMSTRQVLRELKVLEDHGYLNKRKEGRNNHYTLREKVQVTDTEGRPTAVATWDYLPNSVKSAVADLKNVLVTGDLSGAKVVHIERLHLNVQINNAGGNFQLNAADFDKLPEEWKNTLRAIRDNKRGDE
jgi:DNA-binding transcriptional ArsR family regulator